MDRTTQDFAAAVATLENRLRRLPDETELADEQRWTALRVGEATSALHAMRWRREPTSEQAEAMRERILGAPVLAVTRNEVALEVWRVADEFGWAKAYDAQYIALARILGCRLVTLDAERHASGWIASASTVALSTT